MPTEGGNETVAVKTLREARRILETAGRCRSTENENEIVVIPRTHMAAGPRAGLGVRGHARPNDTRVTRSRGIPPTRETKALVNLLAGVRTLYRPTFLTRYPKPMVFSRQSSSPQRAK